MLRDVSRLNVWMDLLADRQPEIYEHSLRAAILTHRLLRELRMDAVDVATGSVGAFAHDVGKLFVPNAIIHKDSAHNEEEKRIMRSHVTLGESLVEQIDRQIACVVGAHHERFDGTGYPRGTPGPLLTPIQLAVTIVDSFVAMTENRSYQVALSGDASRAELLTCSGTQFADDIVKTFEGISYFTPTESELALVDRTFELLGIRACALKWSVQTPGMLDRMRAWETTDYQVRTPAVSMCT